MEYREIDRYAISDAVLDAYALKEVSCEFDFDRSLRGRVVDISLKGLGIEIGDLNIIQSRKIGNLDKYLLNIIFGEVSILAGVKSVWSQELPTEESLMLKAGVLIDLISTEDRLKLSEIIEKIRARI
jgi:hypothetical protein